MRVVETTLGAFDVAPFLADAYAPDAATASAPLVVERGVVRGAPDARAIPVARVRAVGPARGALVVHAHATGSSASACAEALVEWCARLGCDACAFDAVGHGASAAADGTYGEVLARAYARGEGRARWVGARPYVTDGGVDCLRVARALGARRVLLTGESLGGMVVAAAAGGWTREWGFRIVACAPMVGFSRFAYGLERGRWFARAMSLPPEVWWEVSEGARRVPALEDARAFYARACPELCGGAHDGDAVLARIRANGVHFLAVNGANDPRNPMEGVEEAYAKLSPLTNLGARPQCTIVARVGVEHAITNDMFAEVRKFFTNVLKNPLEPEAMTFDENEWDVVANDAAVVVRADVRDKLHSWASGRGVDFALYLSEEERLFLAAGVDDSTATSESESVQAVTRLIDATKARLAEKYVSPFEIARAEKQAAEEARRAAEEREWRMKMEAEREAERQAERERVEKEEKRRVEEEERRIRAEEARRREEAEQLARAAAENEMAQKRAREKEEKERLERERLEVEKARRAAEEAERARKEEGLAKARELLSKKAETKKAELESARDRARDKLTSSSKNLQHSSSWSDRVARLKISKEDSSE